MPGGPFFRQLAISRKSFLLRVILPFGVLLLGVPSPRPPLSVFRPELPYPGFWPSSRHHQLASTINRGSQLPIFVSSSGSLNLTTFCSASWLAGLFHPAAASRTHPVQGLLSSRRSALSSKADAPLSLPPVSSSVPRCPHDQRLDFEAFLAVKQRFVRKALSPTNVRSPPQVSCSSRLRSSEAGAGYPASSALGVDHVRFTFALRP